MPVLLPPSIFRLAVAAPPPLPGVGRPRVLLRRLLLGIFPMLLSPQPPQLVQGIPRQRELHPSLLQTLREISHELVDPGFPEQLLRLLPADTPADRELDSSLLVMLVIDAHQFPERPSWLASGRVSTRPERMCVFPLRPGLLSEKTA
jgi:hypothetical protein